MRARSFYYQGEFAREVRFENNENRQTSSVQLFVSLKGLNMKNINQITTFNLTKIAAVTLSALLIFGCDDVTPNTVSTSTNSSTDSSTDVSTSDLGQYAIITNMEAGSSGQMRYPVASITGSELTTGQVDASVFYSSSETETAYLTLFNVDGNTSGSVGEIQLDSGKIKVRTGGVSTESDVTFTTGEWINVNITWDIEAGTFTASVGGQSVGTFPLNNSAATGVDTIGFKIGNNDLTSSQEFLVDDFEIYSDVAGTTSVFIDDYESYVFEELLDGSGDPYKSETQPAVVGGDAVSDETTTDETTTVTDDFESYAAGTLISDANSAWSTANIIDDAEGTTTAEVSETMANGGLNSLYLADKNTGTKPYAWRTFSDTTVTSGSVSIDVYTPSNNAKTTYINVGVGKDNADRYFELRLSSNLGYENSDSGDVTISDSGFTQDAWHTVNIAWTEANIVTVSLDGTVIAENIDQSTLGLNANKPTQFTVYTGDTGGNDNEAYFDNLDSDLF